MKKIIILFLCVCVTLKNSYGQQQPGQTNKAMDVLTHAYKIGPIIIIGGLFLAQKIKKHRGEKKPKYKIPSAEKENIRQYKSQVQELAQIMNSDNLQKDKFIINSKMKSIQGHYNSSSNFDPSFVEKISKYKSQYDRLKIKYSTFIYQTYFPEYEKEKKQFNSNLTANNISTVKNNLIKLNVLKYEICWDNGENISISNEVQNFNEIMDVYNKYQEKLFSVQSQLKETKVSKNTYKNIMELEELASQWEYKTKLSNSSMQIEINNLKCEFHKNLYPYLTVLSQNILSKVITKDNIDAFNSSVKEFSSLNENAKPDNCVAIQKFNLLKEKITLKSKKENEKIAKEEELENERIAKEAELNAQKIKEENPVKIINIMMYPNEIGIPVAITIIDNQTDEPIIAVDAEISCYDAMGRKLNYFLSDSHIGLVTFKVYILPGDTEPLSYTFNDNWGVQDFDIKIVRIRYENGKIVKLKKPISYVPSSQD